MHIYLLLFNKHNKKYRDYQENIDKIDDPEHYKIVGVKVSTKTLHLSNKKHQTF